MTAPDASPAAIGDPDLVHVVEVSKTYRLGDGSTLHAVDRVSLTIGRGSFTCLLGPSGSGKSTLLHLIGAIDSADTGRITVDGLELTGLGRNALADYRATIGFVFQRFHLIPALTAADNVLAPLVRRRRAKDAKHAAIELLDAVGLHGREDALPSQLSGGQQQRVAIARALISKPALLLADEPTGNLDSTTADDMVELLHDIRTRFGTTVLMATHDEDLAATADARIAVRDGRVAHITHGARPDD